MGLVLLTERHAQQISGMLSCYDRVIVQGTLPVFCDADGMTAYLTKRGIPIFDFTLCQAPHRRHQGQCRAVGRRRVVGVAAQYQADESLLRAPGCEIIFA